MTSRTHHGIRARDVWRSDPRHLANHAVTVALTFGLGLAVPLSDTMRFSSPSYVSLRESYGGTTAWGIALMLGGLWLAGAALLSARAVRIALLGTGALAAFLAWTFIAAQASSDGASPWGWLLFGGLAARHVMQALWFPSDRR